MCMCEWQEGDCKYWCFRSSFTSGLQSGTARQRGREDAAKLGRKYKAQKYKYKTLPSVSPKSKMPNNHSEIQLLKQKKFCGWTIIMKLDLREDWPEENQRLKGAGIEWLQHNKTNKSKWECGIRYRWTAMSEFKWRRAGRVGDTRGLRQWENYRDRRWKGWEIQERLRYSDNACTCLLTVL